ncbi:hypothetical protein KQY10_11435 [Leptospira interrogans]|uniref:hypothetical protein n=1 Tax=Leptospira interrogans TaxID=173 RepID=UPI00046C695D|nr:hypothetical protein [Leptospira interrogans]MCD1166201.1 hypothetical protein [Leptospira interrogans]MCH1886502.1 hypothetical protein [Leptospira interrogans]MCH1892770.1 hypothetical protein [Leptospira interrogans]MCH1899614.1 hypothetical protein [Leptospira interrogans]MCH1902946.1 hypothetical protein [Leptospira interrogans]
MKVVNISSKQKRNCLALRKGGHLILEKDILRFEGCCLRITLINYPNRHYPITLTGAKSFLKNGTVAWK